MSTGRVSTGRVSTRLGARVAAVVVPLLLLAATACGGSAPATTAAPVDTASAPATSASPSPSVSATPRPDGPRPLPSTKPVGVDALTIPAIDLSEKKFEKLALIDDGSLEAPVDPDLAGYYADGTVPGDTGPALIAGHVDSKTGPAVFARLSELRKGDTIEVGLTNGKTKTFVVDRAVTVPKAEFPTQEVYGPTPDAELRLVTCGGPYDRTVGSYVDNTVVFATAKAGKAEVTKP